MSKICIVNSLKRRNNAVSNLAVGLRFGFQSIDQDFYVIQYQSERVIDPSKITEDTDFVIIPHWIGREAFTINIGDIRRIRPHVKIGLYTGTSPFWDGCSWVSYNPSNRFLNCLEDDIRDNFNAIDFYFVVSPKTGIRPFNQVDVGMGELPEIKCGPKIDKPTIILDYLKKDWDERTYRQSVVEINEIANSIKDLTVIILGINSESEKLSGNMRKFVIPHEYNTFDQMADMWAKSWAFVCHNESFGYCLVENMLSGTQVFTSHLSELPGVHVTPPSSVKNIVKMKDHLDKWTNMSSDQRQQESLKIRKDYADSRPQFCSWEETCTKIIQKFQDTKK